MALPTFHIVNVLKRELKQFNSDDTVKFDCPVSTVASLARVSSGKISAYMNEVQRVPHNHEIALRKSWSDLKRLIEFSDPLPLDFRKVDKLRECIAMMEDQTLQIVVFKQNVSATTTSL
jgi:hypothetical protein